MKIGIIREGKTPPDKRVPFTPQQCQLLKKKYSDLELKVESSDIRAFSDQEYKDAGIEVAKDLSDCDVIMGVKEVNIEDLIPNKRFLFFSHTFKKQPYNRDLLRAILDKKIALTDYETMTDASGKRLIGFGRYAGIVGCYNAFRAFGLKSGRYDIKPAHKCEDRKEMEDQLKYVDLPKELKIVLTGKGRVGHGALEIIKLLPIEEVSPEDYLTKHFDKPVYAVLDVQDYNAPKDGTAFNKKQFYTNASNFISTFSKYLPLTDIYIACHYWDASAPFIMTRDDLKQPNVKLQVVADISCDIDGPVACTLRPSTIADPIYGYDPIKEVETAFDNPKSIAVMAVDNLPCELPKDASQDFGNELIKNIIPVLLGEDPYNIIDRATETTFEGKLNSHYSYLKEYVEGQ